MAWIRNQYYGNTETAVVPSDMPPYTPQISGITCDTSDASVTWFTVRSGYPTLGANNIECEFSTASGSSTNDVTGRSYVKFANVLDVSNKTSIKLYASLRYTGGDTSHPVTFRAIAKYKGNQVAASDNKQFKTSGSGNNTITIDITNVNKIDEIQLNVTTHGRSQVGAKGWRFYQAQSNYIKFE